MFARGTAAERALPQCLAMRLEPGGRPRPDPRELVAPQPRRPDSSYHADRVGGVPDPRVSLVPVDVRAERAHAARKPITQCTNRSPGGEDSRLREVPTLLKMLSRILCRLGVHDFRLVEMTVSFGSEGGVEKVRCTRCGLTITRAG